MRILKLNSQSFQTCVREAAQVLEQGGVVIYPTDTIYGMGADALSDAAFKKVCKAKDRDERRPMYAVFADMEMIERYAVMTPMGRRLAEKFWPGPLTFILDKKKEVRTGIARGLPAMGVRIPKNKFCLRLARAFGRPFTTSPAHTSDTESGDTIRRILQELDDTDTIDLVIDAGALPAAFLSTIVDVRRKEPLIIREGAIRKGEILNALHG